MSNTIQNFAQSVAAKAKQKNAKINARKLEAIIREELGQNPLTADLISRLHAIEFQGERSIGMLAVLHSRDVTEHGEPRYQLAVLRYQRTKGGQYQCTPLTRDEAGKHLPEFIGDYLSDDAFKKQKEAVKILCGVSEDLQLPLHWLLAPQEVPSHGVLKYATGILAATPPSQVITEVEAIDILTAYDYGHIGHGERALPKGPKGLQITMIMPNAPYLPVALHYCAGYGDDHLTERTQTPGARQGKSKLFGRISRGYAAIDLEKYKSINFLTTKVPDDLSCLHTLFNTSLQYQFTELLDSYRRETNNDDVTTIRAVSSILPTKLFLERKGAKIMVSTTPEEAQVRVQEGSAESKLYCSAKGLERHLAQPHYKKLSTESTFDAQWFFVRSSPTTENGRGDMVSEYWPGRDAGRRYLAKECELDLIQKLSSFGMDTRLARPKNQHEETLSLLQKEELFPYDGRQQEKLLALIEKD